MIIIEVFERCQSAINQPGCILAHADHIDKSLDFGSLFDLVNHLLRKKSRPSDFRI